MLTFMFKILASAEDCFKAMQKISAPEEVEISRYQRICCKFPSVSLLDFLCFLFSIYIII